MQQSAQTVWLPAASHDNFHEGVSSMYGAQVGDYRSAGQPTSEWVTDPDPGL
jgi:hypothetical protein